MYTQDNQGISYTRQKLFDLSKGEYVMFIDPDDHLMDKVIVSLIKDVIKMDADAIYFNYIKRNDTSIEYCGIGNNHLYSSRDLIEDIIDFTDIVPLWQFILNKKSVTEKFEDSVI